MSAVRLIIAALCLATLPAAALAAWSNRIPDLELRTQPWRTHSGTISSGVPVGQAFLCESDGLHAIDVAVSSSAGYTAGEFELSLRELSPAAHSIRRVRTKIAGVPADGGFLLEFDPVPDSRGKRYEFELSPVSSMPRALLTPYVIYRGQPQSVRMWGDHAASAEELEGTFICEHPDLRALAIGLNAFDPSAGSAAIELWYADQSGEPLVRAEIAPRVPIENGWAFFPMPVVHDSRWKTFRYRLTLPKMAQASAGSGLSMISYHGSGQVSPRLLGMTVRREVLDDRDVVFRAWTERGIDELWERAPAALWLALALWIVAALIVLGMFQRLPPVAAR